MAARRSTAAVAAALAVALVGALVGCGSPPPPTERAVAPTAASASASAGTPVRRDWVVTAASSINSAEPWDAAEVWADGLDDRTLRQQVHASIGGDAARVTLSNRSGAEPLVVGAATVAVAAEAAGAGAEVRPGSVRTLVFDGSASVTIAPGEERTSDPVELDVPADHDLAVSLHATAPTGRPNGARYSGQTAWRGAGDLVGSADGAGFTESRTALSYVAAVEVRAADPEGAVVVFGDSKSDGGLAVNPDSEQRWSDVLHARLVGEGRLGVAVANVSFMGATLLPADDPSSGLARFDADVLARSGVRSVVIALGTNDLLWRTTDEIVAALDELVDRGHAAGIRVVGATMPPFAGPREGGRCLETDPPSMRREGTRLEVNDRIRGEGTPAVGFDAVVDLDAALRDPDDRTRIACGFSDYGLSHPNMVGHAAMARAVDLDALMP